MTTDHKKDGMTSSTQTQKPITDPRKCKMHNMWMRKGQCEICRLAADQAQAKQDAINGVIKPKIKIGKL